MILGSVAATVVGGHTVNIGVRVSKIVSSICKKIYIRYLFKIDTKVWKYDSKSIILKAYILKNAVDWTISKKCKIIYFLKMLWPGM